MLLLVALICVLSAIFLCLAHEMHKTAQRERMRVLRNERRNRLLQNVKDIQDATIIGEDASLLSTSKGRPVGRTVGRKHRRGTAPAIKH